MSATEKQYPKPDTYFVCSCGTPEERSKRRGQINPKNVPLDQIIWAVSQIGRDVKILSDQWWGISVRGTYGKLDEDNDPTYEDGVNYATYVQCDELDLGMMKTWEMWAKKFESINKGRRPWVSWEEND